MKLAIYDNKITSNNLNDNTIDTVKIVGVSEFNNGTNYLNNKGLFVPVPVFDGSVVKLGDLINDMNNKKIINVLDPVLLQDAATKKYVDQSVSSV
jgi:hypothetical protein